MILYAGIAVFAVIFLIFWVNDLDLSHLVWISLVIFAIMMFAPFLLPKTAGEERTQESKLQALSSDTSLSGEFFLGSGFLEEKPVFFYLEDHGTYVSRGHARADRARIFTDEEPRIVQRRMVYEGWLWPTSIGDTRTYTDFYVPEGSISNEFEVTP